MKKLKIGFVIDDGLDVKDGVQQYVLTLGQWLSGRGHEIHYLAGETKSKNIKNVFSLSKNLSVRFNANRLRTPLPASSSKIKKVLSSQNFDILHVQVPYSPFMAGKVISAAQKNTKIVGTFHILPYGKMQKAGVYLLGRWMRSSLSKFDSMLSVSPPAQQLCLKAFGVESLLMPNLVDLSKMSTAKSEVRTKKRIVFLGRLVERKGCLQLIKAIQILENTPRNVSLPDYEVFIGGIGPSKNKVISEIKRHGLEEKIHLKGFIDETSKPAFLKNADTAVFPSLGGESFGIVLIEAMAAGSKVVIGGDNPGYRSVLETVPESLVDASDVPKLADKLEKVLTDERFSDHIHAKQQNIVKKYDVQFVGAKIEKIYDKLAK